MYCLVSCSHPFYREFTMNNADKNDIKTPYEQHKHDCGGDFTKHSPNGIDTIEECTDCGQRFLHNPVFRIPITLH